MCFTGENKQIMHENKFAFISKFTLLKAFLVREIHVIQIWS